MAYAGLQELGDGFRGGLGTPVEEGVPAAQVGAQRMFRTTAVPQEHLVLLAGAAAIGVVMALREERAEQAMLHMKEGHVLVQR